MRITHKTQMYDLYTRGLFGNTLKAWSVDEFLQSDYQGEVGIRCKKVGGPCITGLDRYGLTTLLMELHDAGWSKDDYVVCEGVDDSKRTIQGEVCLSENHYDLTYTTAKKPMRPALVEQTLHAQGLTAKFLLQEALDPSSYNDLQELLTTYSGAVVEFTCFSQDVGILPHRNTVFWEVRHY